MVISDEILAFAGEILSGDKIRLAEKLSRDLSDGRKKRDEARRYLRYIVRPPPKRPLYYCNNEIRHLPRWTRNIVRYLGDYIDQLERELLKKFMEENKIKKSPKYMRDQLRPYIPNDLYKSLEDYDKLFWRPAKHDFNVDESSRRHRFTTRETVYDIFITLAIADELKKLIED